MNSVARAQAAAYGKFTTGSVMKDAPVLNIHNGDANRNINMNTNHARGKNIMRLDNRQVRDRTVTLYDPKSAESAYNYLVSGDNSMLQKMQQDGRKKIEFLNEELIPNYNEKFDISGNELDNVTSHSINSYYPKLPVSAYNQPPKNMKPTLIDERMRQHTTDREFAWEDDQENLRRNILKDPRRWERIERQNEADRRLYGMGQGVDRWDENKNAYTKHSAIQPEFLLTELKKRIDDRKKYNDLDDASLTRSIEKRALAPLSEFEGAANIEQQHHGQSGNNQFMVNRNVNRYDYTYEEPGTRIEKKSIFDPVINTVMKLFKKTDHTSSESYRRQENDFKEYNDRSYDTEVTMNRERNDTVFAVRDGSVFTVAPDNYEVYGSTFVSPVSKMMAILNNGQLHIVQKMKADRILGSDARPVGDDLIVTVLPSSITEKIKHRLHQSEGRMIQEMNTEDFKQLLEFIENNPSIQRRTTVESISKMLGDNAIDQAMLGNFGGNNTLVQDDMLYEFIHPVSRNNVDLNKDTFRRREEFHDDELYFNSKPVAIPRGAVHEHIDRRASTITNRNILEEANQLIPEIHSTNYRTSDYKTAPRKLITGKQFSDMM